MMFLLGLFFGLLISLFILMVCIYLQINFQAKIKSVYNQVERKLDGRKAEIIGPELFNLDVMEEADKRGDSVKLDEIL